MADMTLDCKGMNCPMPIIKINKTMKGMSSGQTLEVLATDPAFAADLNAWARKLKNEIVELEAGTSPIRAVIRKK